MEVIKDFGFGLMKKNLQLFATCPKILRSSFQNYFKENGGGQRTPGIFLEQLQLSTELLKSRLPNLRKEHKSIMVSEATGWI